MYVIGELDQERYLSKQLIENIFSEVDSYFDIVSCLYIVKDKKVYNTLKSKIIDIINMTNLKKKTYVLMGIIRIQKKRLI